MDTPLPEAATEGQHLADVRSASFAPEAPESEVGAAPAVALVDQAAPSPDVDTSAPPDDAGSDVDAASAAEATPLFPGPARTAPRSVSEIHLKGIIESLVFVSDRPLTAADIARLARAEARDTRRLLNELREDYRGRGVQLDEIAGGWQFRSSAANAPFVRELLQAKPVRLTRAQVETLAIVAYRQPITRPEVDDIRGVDTGSALKVLLDRDLIRVLGRKEEVGRPVLYGTSGHFLEFFGLKSLRDLPTLRDFTDLSPESEATLIREMGDEAVEGAAAARPLEARAPEHDAVATDSGTAPPASGADGTDSDESLADGAAVDDSNAD